MAEHWGRGKWAKYMVDTFLCLLHLSSPIARGAGGDRCLNNKVDRQVDGVNGK